MRLLYQSAKVTSIKDPEDKGRVKCQFYIDDIETEDFVVLVDSFYSGGDNGWNGQLAVDDNIIISFLDYPKCQKPFVFGKPKSNNQSIKREDNETLKIKDHIVEFSKDSVTIKHKDKKSSIILDSDTITIQSNPSAPFTLVRAEVLKTWLTTHVHLGNLGFLTLPTTASGFPWLEEISSKNIKIT